MPCFHPLDAWRPIDGSSKLILTYHPKKCSSITPHLQVPCGQCVGCRLERSRQWAIRCVHEASLYADNCFITLTYNSENLPHDSSLDVREFQLFMKRLRKRFGEGIRFFHCGEYGENFGRPHYHACLFNFDFPDKVLWRISDSGEKLYRSAILEELWPFGFSSVGSVSFKSAAYVARYIMKKITGDAAERHYIHIDRTTGEIHTRKPEYTTMSRRPGIGKAWFDKYHSDVYPDDFVIINDKKMKPPRYYDTQFELLYPHEMDDLKLSRELSAEKRLDNNTVERLAVREQVQLARLSKLKKSLE